VHPCMHRIAHQPYADAPKFQVILWAFWLNLARIDSRSSCAVARRCAIKGKAMHQNHPIF
jgi:hypothetical protein